MPRLRNVERLREAEVWIAWVRLAAVAFAVVEVGVFSTSYPAGYQQVAWIVTAVFGVGAVAFFVLSRRRRKGWLLPLGIAALLFDTVTIGAFATIYSYEYGSPTRWALVFAVVEGALRYGLVGGALVPLALLPFLIFVEWWRAHKFGPPGFLADRITFPFGILFLTGAIVGWLVNRLDREAATARSRASEAERLRDELGRRVDVLEAANRAARALGSSLDVDQAFTAFIRELRGVMPFDRMAIVLEEAGGARVMAASGIGTEGVFPAGSIRPLGASLLGQVLEGETVYRPDMTEPRFIEEEDFFRLGLRSRLAAPLLVAARPIGMLSLARKAADSFSADEIELIGLLGRLVGSAVQNIRAYEAERQTAEELRRLSALRADFVSLVSHELRSPMAAVIGAARTLQERWRGLSPEQREAFLGLIADETSRLAALVGDVLDTSRIDAGTFSYVFDDVDIGELVREAAATADLGHDEVTVRAVLDGPLPPVRGDRVRLRQVLTNLIDNAVKYSPAGDEVEVAARAQNSSICIEVTDRGPGIAWEQQQLIFEKFGRANVAGSKPGTGLGLFIARSIAEAHGGSVEVRSTPESGATFILVLPTRP